jgi:hypothetical protein
MKCSALSRFARSFLGIILITIFVIPQNIVAQATQHLVSPGDLQKAAADASQRRQQNMDTLNSFLSTAQAEKALQSAHMNPQEVKKGVAGLSDEELAQLASRANKAQADFAAGSLGNHDLLIILVCIAVLILVIVAVR